METVSNVDTADTHASKSRNASNPGDETPAGRLSFGCANRLIEKKLTDDLARAGKPVAVDNVVMQVLAVLSFIPRAQEYEQIAKYWTKNTAAKPEPEGYDILLSDGRICIKTTLSPNLAHIVNSGNIRAFSVVEIYEMIFINYSELNESSPGQRSQRLFFISGIKVLRQHNDVIFDDRFGSEQITLAQSDLREEKDSERFWAPQIPTRGSYVALSTIDSPASSFCLHAPYDSLEAASVRFLCQRLGHGIHINRHKIDEQKIRMVSATDFTFIDEMWQTQRDKKDGQNLPWVSSNDFAQTSIRVEEAQKSVRMLRNKTHRNFQSYKTGSFVGYIVRKSSPVYFGKWTKIFEKTQQWPVKFHFWVADSVGVNHSEVKVTCWNHACVKYFSQVFVGGVVVVQNPRFKILQENGDGDGSKFEFVINDERGSSVDKRAQLYFCSLEYLSNKYILPEWDEVDPRLENVLFYHQVQTEALKALSVPQSERKRYTVFGLLTYVGRREVLVTANDSKKFEYRWIRIRVPQDRRSESATKQSGEFCLQLFSNSQARQFLLIRPGDAIAVSCVALHPHIACGCMGPLSVCMRSTFETSVLSGEEFEASLPRLYKYCCENLTLGETSWIYSHNCSRIPIEARYNIFEADYGLRLNVSREIFHMPKDENMISMEKFDLDDGWKQIRVPFSQGNVVQSLAARFSPLESVTIESFKQESSRLRLAETRYYLLNACIRTLKLLRNQETQMYELDVELVSPPSLSCDRILKAKCTRDPIIGPIVSHETLKSKALARKYFMLRIRGLVHGQDGQVFRTAQDESNGEEPQSFLLEMHKTPSESVEIRVVASFVSVLVPSEVALQANRPRNKGS